MEAFLLSKIWNEAAEGGEKGMTPSAVGDEAIQEVYWTPKDYQFRFP
jgi:hypothetical protein